MRRIALAIAALGLASPALANPADGRAARCVVESASERAFRGPCMFYAEGGGSFTISPLDEASRQE